MKKYSPQEITPQRFGLKNNPPQIIMEVLNNTSNKLYHYKIKLPKLKTDSNLDDVLKEIYEKHSPYLEKVQKSQMIKLVVKLQCLLSKDKSKLNDYESDEDTIEVKVVVEDDDDD